MELSMEFLSNHPMNADKGSLLRRRVEEASMASVPASRTGFGDFLVYLKSPVKSLLCPFLLRLMDGMPSRMPKLLDGFSAPLSTPFGNTNGFAFKDHLHRVVMQLGKLPQGNPAALIDGEVCLQVVNRSISRDDPTAHRVSIDNQFPRVRASQCNGLWWGPMKGDSITHETFASRRRSRGLERRSGALPAQRRHLP